MIQITLKGGTVKEYQEGISVADIAKDLSLSLIHIQMCIRDSSGKTIKLTAKAGTNGRLFGSVTAKEIAEELEKSYHVSIDKRKISLESDIKAYGSYSCEIKLHTGVSAKMTVMITEE